MTNIEARKRWKVVLASIFKAHFIGFWLSFCMNPPFTLLPLPQRKYFLTVSNSTKWSLKPQIFAFEWNSFFLFLYFCKIHGCNGSNSQFKCRLADLRKCNGKVPRILETGMESIRWILWWRSGKKLWTFDFSRPSLPLLLRKIKQPLKNANPPQGF